MEDIFEMLREEKGRSKPPNERLMSVAEVASWLGVSASWVREHGSHRKVPHIPSIRMGGLLKFRRGVIEEWLTEKSLAA